MKHTKLLLQTLRVKIWSWKRADPHCKSYLTYLGVQLAQPSLISLFVLAAPEPQSPFLQQPLFSALTLISEFTSAFVDNEMGLK